MEKNQIAGCFSFEIREADHEKKTLILYTPDQLTSLKNIEKFTSCCGRVLIDDADVGIPWPVDYSNVPINHYGKFWAVLILKIKGYLSNRHSILSPKY